MVLPYKKLTLKDILKEQVKEIQKENDKDFLPLILTSHPRQSRGKSKNHKATKKKRAVRK